MWLRLELFLSSIWNPESPLINTSHNKSFSKAMLTKPVFPYWDLQTIFMITSTKLLEFCHSSTRQSTHGTVLQHLAPPHLLTGFSLPVLFPWMPEGIKSFFIFISMKHGKKPKAPVPRHSIDATPRCHLWRTQREKRFSKESWAIKSISLGSSPDPGTKGQENKILFVRG